MRSTACRAHTPTGIGDGECSLSGSDTLHELCPTPTPDNASTLINALLNCVFAILETEIWQAVCQLMPPLPQALAKLASRPAKLVAPPSRPIPHAGSRCRGARSSRCHWSRGPPSSVTRFSLAPAPENATFTAFRLGAETEATPVATPVT